MITLIGLGFVGLAIMRPVLALRRRRRRGRWGLLQDRFSSTARHRGARQGDPNPRLAEAWTDADEVAVARTVAQRLDRVAFDPTFVDDDRAYDETRKLIGSLPHDDP